MIFKNPPPKSSPLKRGEDFKAFPPLEGGRFGWGVFATLLFIVFFASPLYALEKKEQPVKTEQSAPTTTDKSARYAPDFCDFEITFPEEPAVAKKCVPGAACYDLHSYTMVYDLQTTIDISVTCNPSTPAAYEKYNQSVMKTALAGMISNRDLKNDEIRFHQLDKNVRTASLTGTGMVGRQDTIYSAQIWVGKNSVFTIQAELIGAAHEQADKEFSEILKSIKMREGE